MNHRARRFARLAARVILAGLGTIVLGHIYLYVTDYPRFLKVVHRSYKGILVDRSIILPLTILTLPEPPVASELPTYRLYFTPQKMKKMRAERYSARSAREYFNGNMVVDGTEYPVKMKIRGISGWHTQGMKYSWKIKLRRQEHLDQDRVLNFLNPRGRATLADYSMYWWATEFGLLSPKVEHVRVFMNQSYAGVYHYLENLDKSFLAQHGLAEGDLLGDEATDVQQYSWHPDSTWEKSFAQYPEDDSAQFEAFLRFIYEADDATFERDIHQFVDPDYVARLVATSRLLCMSHMDESHNNRLYHDVSSGRFYPIFWDPLPVPIARDSNNPLCATDPLATNPLLQRFGAIQAERLITNRLVYEAITASMTLDKVFSHMDAVSAKIRDDLYADPAKDWVDHEFYPLAVNAPTRFRLRPYANFQIQAGIDHLEAYFRGLYADAQQALESNDVTVSQIGPYRFVVDVAGVSEIRLLQVTDAEGGNVSASLLVGGGPEPPTAWLLPPHYQAVRRKELQRFRNVQTELLVPSPVTGVARFEVQTGRPIDGGHFSFKNVITGETFRTLVQSGVAAGQTFPGRPIESSLLDGRPEIVAQPSHAVSLGPGVVRIDQTLIVPRDGSLTIRPGTTLKVAPETSILSYGKVIAVGTPTAPIRVEPQFPDKGWGTFAVQGRQADGFVLRHITFTNGQQPGGVEIDRVIYTGLLAIHNADGIIEHVTVSGSRSDDGVNLRNSDSLIAYSDISFNAVDGLDLDFSPARVEKSTFRNNGNDGIDCGGSDAVIVDNLLLASGDKGISIGEKSRPSVTNNVIIGSAIGIAIKDAASPEIANNILIRNSVAIAVYVKKPIFAAPTASLSGTLLVGNKENFDIQIGIEITGLESGTLAVEQVNERFAAEREGQPYGLTDAEVFSTKRELLREHLRPF